MTQTFSLFKYAIEPLHKGSKKKVKCRWRDSLGFAPREESFAFEPTVQLRSISSLSGLTACRPYANPLEPGRLRLGVLRPLIPNKKEPQRTLFYCRWRDLNPQGLLHTPLKRARLPFRHIDIFYCI